MADKTDRRIRKTKAHLRSGLAKLMQDKSIKEITVKELVDEVDINRSTFYLHYTDIYQMLECIENELLEEILQTIHEHPLGTNTEHAFPFFVEIFTILAQNRDICSALLGENGDINFIHKIQKLLEENCLKVLTHNFPKAIDDLQYSYYFCLTGCVGLIRSWLETGHNEPPEHMATLAYRMITNAMRDFKP